jgi:hypothetical protein
LRSFDAATFEWQRLSNWCPRLGLGQANVSTQPVRIIDRP